MVLVCLITSRGVSLSLSSQFTSSPEALQEQGIPCLQTEEAGSCTASVPLSAQLHTLGRKKKGGEKLIPTAKRDS